MHASNGMSPIASSDDVNPALEVAFEMAYGNGVSQLQVSP